MTDNSYIAEQLRHAQENIKYKNSREYFLDQAKTIVCNDREEQYGNPEDNFTSIALLWDAYLCNHREQDPITAEDVAIMMALFKIGRMMSGKPKEDNWIDAIGYLACGAELETNL